MLDAQIPVPEFIVVSDAFFRAYKKEINFLSQLGALSSPKDDAIRVEKIFRDHPMSSTLVEELKKQIDDHGLEGEEVAVRSSGLDEDSKEHSFAGMFSSFLHQKTISQIEESIRKCWAIAYSERCLEYRLKNKLPTSDIRMGVVIQKMANQPFLGLCLRETRLIK